MNQVESHTPNRSRTVAAAPAAPLRPTGLTVLYDANCPVCRRARRWVERHRHLVPVRFVAAGSTQAQRRFPQLDVGSTLVDVTVVTDEGAVLRGDRAWIAVLWAVNRTRPTAIRLAAGRSAWMFRNVKGATNTVRRLALGQSDAPTVENDERRWPPPPPGNISDPGTCRNCRT